ncbi:MAG: hypothetical protein JNK11_17575, partial [Alphaproteobacteria bacterium]|nr:hypothetical protein [Alphaproteobacteria bacterium]
MPCVLDAKQIAQFHEDGMVVVRGLFDAEETSLLRRAMELDPAVQSHIIDRLDAKGAATKIA